MWLSDVVSGGCGSAGLMVALDILTGLFQTGYFYDSVMCCFVAALSLQNMKPFILVK